METLKKSISCIFFIIVHFFACVSIAQHPTGANPDSGVKQPQPSVGEKFRKLTMHYPDGYQDLLSDYKDRIQKIFREANIDVTFKPVPSERGIHMLRSGESLAELARSADVVEVVGDNYFFIPTPIDILELSYVYKEQKFKKFSTLDVQKVVIGYLQGGRTSKGAAEKFSHVHALKDWESLYKMIESKRLDLFFVLTSQKQRQEIARRGFHIGFIKKHPIYTYLRKDLEGYRDKLNSAYLREFKH